MSTRTLHYVGDTPRANPEMHWRVDVEWTVNGRPGISFFYFRTREDAIATYPEIEPYHCDQCGEFFRSQELHELSHQEAS